MVQRPPYPEGDQNLNEFRRERKQFSDELFLRIGKLEGSVETLKFEIEKLNLKDIEARVGKIDGSVDILKSQISTLNAKDQEISSQTTQQAESFRKTVTELSNNFTTKLEDLSNKALKRADVQWLKTFIGMIMGAAVTTIVTIFLTNLMGSHGG